MSNVKEILTGVFKRTWAEFTRLDLTCNSCKREMFDRGQGTAGEYFCDDCYKHLPYNNGNICARCGRSAVLPVNVCDDCINVITGFEMARSPFYYAPPVDRMIRDFKYRDKRYLAKVFSPFLQETLGRSFADAEVLTFVPMGRRTLRRRWYNQAELLCRELSRSSGLPFVDALVKVADTDRQAILGREMRLKNLKGAIKLRNRALIKDKIVVLIDDVMTTGATAVACSNALKDAGAKKVYVLTVASVTDGFVAKKLHQERSSTSANKKVDRKFRFKSPDKPI